MEIVLIALVVLVAVGTVAWARSAARRVRQEYRVLAGDLSELAASAKRQNAILMELENHLNETLETEREHASNLRRDLISMKGMLVAARSQIRATRTELGDFTDNPSSQRIFVSHIRSQGEPVRITQNLSRAISRPKYSVIYSKSLDPHWRTSRFRRAMAILRHWSIARPQIVLITSGSVAHHHGFMRLEPIEYGVPSRLFADSSGLVRDLVANWFEDVEEPFAMREELLRSAESHKKQWSDFDVERLVRWG
jgi:hypothetical protein